MIVCKNSYRNNIQIFLIKCREFYYCFLLINKKGITYVLSYYIKNYERY